MREKWTLEKKRELTEFETGIIVGLAMVALFVLANLL